MACACTLCTLCCVSCRLLWLLRLLRICPAGILDCASLPVHACRVCCVSCRLLCRLLLLRRRWHLSTASVTADTLSFSPASACILCALCSVSCRPLWLWQLLKRLWHLSTGTCTGVTSCSAHHRRHMSQHDSRDARYGCVLRAPGETHHQHQLQLDAALQYVSGSCGSYCSTGTFGRVSWCYWFTQHQGRPCASTDIGLWTACSLYTLDFGHWTVQ